MIDPSDFGKRKMVSFRLELDEYEEACELSRARGYRSVSSLAQSALLAVLPSHATIRPSREMSLLQRRIDALTEELRSLSRSVKKGE